MKIGIVGSRRRNTFDDYKIILEKLRWILGGFDNECTIISGGCSKGADTFAEQIAHMWYYPIVVHCARWDLYGKSAGLIRNNKIAEESDILIACVSHDRTGGTEDTIRKFVKLKGDKNLHIV